MTKLDLTGAEAARDRIAAELCREVIPISAVTGKGLPALIHRIADLLAETPVARRARPRRRPRPAPVDVPVGGS